MVQPTEELQQQYFDDRLALARLNVMQRIELFPDANLTTHELRIILLIASGVVATRDRLNRILEVPSDSIDTALDNLVQHGYLEPKAHESNNLIPTEEATSVFDAMTDRRDTTMELLANLDPDDLTALVRGTRALRVAMELNASD